MTKPKIIVRKEYRMRTETHSLNWDGDRLYLGPLHEITRHGDCGVEKRIRTPEQAEELADALLAMAKVMRDA